jgi:hypothetical protein
VKNNNNIAHPLRVETLHADKSPEEINFLFWCGTSYYIAEIYLAAPRPCVHAHGIGINLDQRGTMQFGEL